MLDYKKIIKNPDTRATILRLLQIIPDKPMLRLQYFIKTGRWLNLKNPKRYSEKIQWYKLYYRDNKMAECADKVDVRDYVTSKGLENILNKCYGIFQKTEDINWEKLPNSFIIKNSLGGGGRSVILVYDKNTADRELIFREMDKWIHAPKNRKSMGREWVYEGKQPRILIEKLLLNTCEEDLPDYKFFCFEGKAFYSYMMCDYTQHHEKGRLGFFDRNFNLIAHRADFLPIVDQPDKPKNYEKMVEYAEILSKGFPHVRVDFYNIDGQIIFGEMTFFNASGYVVFEPDSFDYTLGEPFNLPNRRR